MTHTRPDPHVVLGVARDASIIEIREAYRQRMRALHPDRGGLDDLVAHAEIAAVNEAWRLLRTPGGVSERSYDQVPNEDDRPVVHQDEGDAQILDGGPVPRKFRTAMTITGVLLLVWMTVFVLIAFSQSG